MAAGGGILNLGLSGLQAAQRALDVTSHNIANVNTPGYSQQRVLLTTRPPQWSGQGFLGTGVDLVDVRRSYDQFLTQEVRIGTSAASEVGAQLEFAAQLDNLFGDRDSGLSRRLQDFFNAIQDAADDPSSLPPRQVMIEQAGLLADRFQTLDARLGELRQGLQNRVRDTVEEINLSARSIARLNQEIVESGATRNDPNDLLDQRDELLRQLAEKISVTPVRQDDGAVNVFIGSGQTLVMGSAPQQLAVEPRPDNPGTTEIVLASPSGGSVAVTPEIHGGLLGGSLGFEQGMLADAQRGLDTLALGIAEQFNGRHELGMNLRGELGGAFFTAVNSPQLQAERAFAHSGNTGSASLVVTVDAAGTLRDSDYRLYFDGAQYSLIRQRDDEVLGTFSSLPQSFPNEGFSLALAGGTPAAGDSFSIQPSAGTARRIQALVADAQSIALASPIRTGASLGNLGDAQISPGRVAALAGTTLGAEITLIYDAGAAAFNLSVPPGGSIPYDPGADSGQEVTLNVPGFGDISFALSGEPADNDSFTVAHNAGGVSDNRNALALADLQGFRFMADGTATLGESYTRFVADLGSRTRGLEFSGAAQEKILARAEDARDAGAGVNLDEEAANLVRYQQAYQASAQLISVSNQLFQTLIGAFGG